LGYLLYGASTAIEAVHELTMPPAPCFSCIFTLELHEAMRRGYPRPQ
jgi:hypothetical protein